jgi:hypothetical protein
MCANKFRIFDKLVLAFLVALLAACNQSEQENELALDPTLDPALIDRSWYTGDPCLPPCWHGMEIGKTTFEEAFPQVTTLSFVDVELIQTRGSGIQLYYQQPEKTFCANMVFDNDILTSILILPNYHVTFMEVVHQLGEPDYILVDPTQRRSCRIWLLWSEQQIGITHFEEHREAKRRLCELVRDSGDRIPTDLYVDDIAIMTTEYLERLAVRPWRGFIDQ